MEKSFIKTKNQGQYSCVFVFTFYIAAFRRGRWKISPMPRWERNSRWSSLYSTRMLIFLVSHDDSFFFSFFVLLREKYRTHSLRFDTKVPAVFPPSSSFSWFTAWFVHNLMDVPLSVRCRFLVSCPFCFVFVNKIQFNEQRTWGSFSFVHLKSCLRNY